MPAWQHGCLEQSLNQILAEDAMEVTHGAGKYHRNQWERFGMTEAFCRESLVTNKPLLTRDGRSSCSDPPN